MSYSAINYNFGVVFCSSPEPPNYDAKACLLPVSFGRIFFLCTQQHIRGEVHNIFISLSCIYIYTNVLLDSVLILAQRFKVSERYIPRGKSNVRLCFGIFVYIYALINYDDEGCCCSQTQKLIMVYEKIRH